MDQLVDVGLRQLDRRVDDLQRLSFELGDQRVLRGEVPVERPDATADLVSEALHRQALQPVGHHDARAVVRNSRCRSNRNCALIPCIVRWPGSCGEPWSDPSHVGGPEVGPVLLTVETLRGRST